MWEKIKQFFKKFWWVFLVPLAIWVLSLFSKDASDVLKEEAKKKKKEIKEEKKQAEDIHKDIDKTESKIKEQEEEVVKKEEKVTENLKELDDAIDKSLQDKELRDRKASELFPGL